MSNSLTALYLSNPELANALRKQQTGQALMQQGMDSSPIQSPWQGVSRLAAALVGGYETGQADRQFKEAGDRSKQESADFFKAVQDAMGGWQPAQPAAPMAGPVSQTPLAPAEMAPLIDAAAKERGMPPSLATALFATESNFNPTARNPRSGAYGLGQVLASTMANPGYGMQPTTEAELSDPRKAIPWSLDYLKARGGALGVTDWNDPQQQARALRAYGENTDEYVNKVQSRMGEPAVPAAGIPQPAAQAGPQDEFLRRAEQAQRKAMAAAAAGEKDLAQQFQNQAVTYRQMAMQRPQTSQTVVADPSSRTGYRYVPSAQAGGMEAPEPRPNVSIENKGEGTWESTRAKDFAERVKGWEDAGVKSTQTLTRLTRMEAMLDNVTTGAGSQTSITAGQLAQRLGVPEATMSMLGIDPKTVAQGEAIRSLASQMLVGMMGAGGFPTNNFSDADRKMLESALPGLQNSPQGNRMIIQIMRAGAQRDLEIGQAWRAWSRVKGDSLASVRDFQAERLPQITERDIVAPLLEQGGWQDANPTGQDANPTGQGAQPAPGGVTEGATATNPQTGQKLIFRGGRWEPAQ